MRGISLPAERLLASQIAGLKGCRCVDGSAGECTLLDLSVDSDCSRQVHIWDRLQAVVSFRCP